MLVTSFCYMDGGVGIADQNLFEVLKVTLQVNDMHNISCLHPLQEKINKNPKSQRETFSVLRCHSLMKFGN